MMDRGIPLPASREQVESILRQRAERNLGVQQQLIRLDAAPVGGGGRGAIAPPVFPPRLMQRFRDLFDPEEGPNRRVIQGGIVPGGQMVIRQGFAGPRIPGGRERLIVGAGGGRPLYRQATLPSSPSEESQESGEPRLVNVAIEGEVISFEDATKLLGIYIDGSPLSETKPFFEIEILEKSGPVPNVIIGLCSNQYPLDIHPGWASESIGFHTGDGSLYRGRPRGQPFGPVCDVGDRIGCGIRGMTSPLGGSVANVFFTKNGKEIGNSRIMCPLPPGGLFPAISLQHPGEEVAFKCGVRFHPEEDMMVVDGGEDDWLRLHDIRLNGQILEYVGLGKSLMDVGLAQARNPICTRNHYFEIEIVDPGTSCFIAIGLARKDYPKNRHPGWNKGSIAYHADDGKVFVGSGVGAPFGPRCHKGDVMGCGVLFPRNYECKSDSEEEIQQQGGGLIVPGDGGHDPLEVNPDFIRINDLGSDSADEDDDWWNDQVFVQSGVKVQIYFTRNGKVIGMRDVRIPKGGFYPTVGMMSCQEKVRVDLRPLSG